ncbi:MAG: ATP-binding protein, partial [Thiovulaceae bacterium]|nr:ATP-binding protein [Sulfurimonadaceae bacterium]
DKLINILKKTAKVIQTDQRARLEQEKILSENSDLTMANEELEQQVRAEMYNADNNTFILEQYKDAIDKILIVSKTDLNGVITFANDNFCSISGYTLDELIGQNHSIVRHPSNPRSLFTHMWEKIQAKKPWHGLLKNRTKEGATYYVQTSIIPLVDAKGDLLEYIALREDVTETMKYQKRLEERNKRIDIILDNQQSIVLLVNASGEKPKITHLNATFFESHNYKNIEEFKSSCTCICELFVQRDGYMEQSTDAVHWTEPLLREPDKIHKAIIVNNKDEERVYHVQLKQLDLEEGLSYLITFTDITEVEQLRLIAEEAEKAKSAFLANMSHEIRTPINGINGFTQLLKESELNQQQYHYLDLIDTSTKLLIGTINDILDFSKIESNKMELSYTNIDLVKEMNNFVKIFMEKAHEKSIDFVFTIDEEIHPVISIDPLHLKQILSNLISNALKFTPENGSIAFHIQKIKENDTMQTLKFSIKDSGIGIPKERHHAIFESFTQADSSTTRKFGGTGLGLSISNSLVNLMGGKLSLESQEDHGSSFSFELHLYKEDPNKVSLDDDQETTITENMHFDLDVLVVEDYDINQILITTLLDNLGITSHLAENGQQAVDMSRQHAYDLILMDINMPIMNGIDATTIIKKEDKNPVPIIALTANILDEDIRRCIDAGMEDTLIKPIQPKKLTKILENYANKKGSNSKKTSEVKEDKVTQEFPFEKAKTALGLPEKTLIAIVQKFIDSTYTLLITLEEAIQMQDLETINSIGHRLKGSASTLCFEDITAQAKMLENLSLPQISDAAHFHNMIENDLQQIKGSLEPLL